MTPITKPISVSPKEAARMLGVSRGHVYDLLNGLKIKSHKSGSRRLVDYESLLAYYEQSEVGA